MDDVGFGIPFRRGGGRRAAQHDRSAGPVRADDDVLNLFPLDVHAGGEHDVGPAQVVLRGGPDVLVDEPDFPAGRRQRGDEQDALRRHERLDRAHQWESVVECGKRPGVLREEAQNPARMLGRELKSGIRRRHLTLIVAEPFHLSSPASNVVELTIQD